MNNVCVMSLNFSGEISGTKGQTGTKEQGQRQGYSLPPYGYQSETVFGFPHF
jgi:hypothetical protein